MNKRQKKKVNKDCSSCRFFSEWDSDSGQYDEYGRCELPPYFCPLCSKMEEVENEYDLPFGGDFREQIKGFTGKYICKFFRKKIR